MILTNRKMRRFSVDCLLTLIMEAIYLVEKSCKNQNFLETMIIFSHESGNDDCLKSTPIFARPFFSTVSARTFALLFLLDDLRKSIFLNRNYLQSTKVFDRLKQIGHKRA